MSLSDSIGCFRINTFKHLLTILSILLEILAEVYLKYRNKMKQDDLFYFRKWFSDYCLSFYSSDLKDQRNIVLKEQHTAHVCENILLIAEKLFLSEQDKFLAETVALFHDVGRFPQYAQFRTFRDSISVNHGVLGAQVLRDHSLLNNLAEHEQEIILKSVRFHNAFSVPKNENDRTVFFIKLIRDADKLDIWRVFLEYYGCPEEERASAAGLGFTDLPEYSDEVLSLLFSKKVVPLLNIRTLNDLRLLQLSWIFDLNFLPSFKMVLERDYVNRYISFMPKTDEIRKVASFLLEFISSQAASLVRE
jgi:hypothetical protein